MTSFSRFLEPLPLPTNFSFLSTSFPQLPPITSFQELIPGVETGIEGIPEIKLMPLPVYHGDRAPGPNMLVFQINLPDGSDRKIIFTGDILCPLLRKADFRLLSGAVMLFTDANNRFPYPASNHWSITGESPESPRESGFLKASP